MKPPTEATIPSHTARKVTFWRETGWGAWLGDPVFSRVAAC
jgi:hypothetical protein